MIFLKNVFNSGKEWIQRSKVSLIVVKELIALNMLSKNEINSEYVQRLGIGKEEKKWIEGEIDY